MPRRSWQLQPKMSRQRHGDAPSIILFNSPTALALLASTSSAAQQAKDTPPQGVKPLKTIREVRELPSEKARLRYPVHLRAVVTYANRPQGDLFLQDSTAGIFVNAGQSTFDFHSGQYVEINGLSSPGDFASEIENPKIRVLGEAPLPVPLKVSGDVFVTGSQDSQFVEIEGMVKSAAENQGGLLCIWRRGLPTSLRSCWTTNPSRETLWGQGPAARSFRRALQSSTPVPGCNPPSARVKYLIVETPAPADLFSIPVRPIHIVLRLGPAGDFEQRVHVQGIVTLQQSGKAIYIRDAQEGLEVADASDDPRAGG